MIILKGQFWSFDMIFAIVIFSFAITILAFTWFSINNQLSISNGNNAGFMQQQLQQLSDNILLPGRPFTWDTGVSFSNYSSWQNFRIGLTDEIGSTTIDSNKLYTLLSMANSNYQATKGSLGISFDYYITITSISNIGSGINISIGRNPLGNGALTVYTEKSYGMLNDVPVTVTTMLWTNTTISES